MHLIREVGLVWIVALEQVTAVLVKIQDFKKQSIIARQHLFQLERMLLRFLAAIRRLARIPRVTGFERVAAVP